MFKTCVDHVNRDMCLSFAVYEMSESPNVSYVFNHPTIGGKILESVGSEA